MSFQDLMKEMSDKCLKGYGITKKGKDVEECDALGADMAISARSHVLSQRSTLTSLGKPEWTPSRDLRCATLEEDDIMTGPRSGYI